MDPTLAIGGVSTLAGILGAGKASGSKKRANAVAAATQAAAAERARQAQLASRESQLSALGSSYGEQKGALTNAMNQQLGYQTTGLANQTGAIGHNYGQAISGFDPYTKLGSASTQSLGALMGLPGYGTPGVSPTDVLMNTPGAQFRYQTGLDTAQNYLQKLGMSQSGRAQKELTNYGQNYASNEYQNEYNRLAGLSQQGQGAAGSVGNLYAYQGANLSDVYGKNANQMSGIAGNYGTNMSNIAGAYGGNVAGVAQNYGNALSGIETGQGNVQSNIAMQRGQIGADYASDLNNAIQGGLGFAYGNMGSLKNLLGGGNSQTPGGGNSQPPDDNMVMANAPPPRWSIY